jgi:opacity protein-like surface antigen
MNFKSLIAVFLVAALAGCASAAANTDPVRAQAAAGVAQARANGSLPLSEAQYVYPNWAAANKAP